MTFRKADKDKIYLSPPHMGGDELNYIYEAFDTNWISTVGPQIEQFERKLEDYTGVNHSAVLSSGTAAIHLALKMLGVGPGDKVICQTFTFAGSANPITYLGAEPVFIDSEKETWNLDPALLEDYLNASTRSRVHPSTKVKAIIPVHLYGMPYKTNEIYEIAQRYDIPVIEDAAEALGSSVDGKMCGSFGEFGILSFNGNKIITTSGGGALLSNNAKWITKSKFLATQARDPAPHYEHTEVGYNYRMGNINAAIGLGQMEVLEQRVRRRREIWNTYFESFKDVFEFQAPQIETDSSKSPVYASTRLRVYSNRWLTTILTDSFETREKIRFKLETQNIEARPLWKPMHMQPVFKSAECIGGKISEDLFTRGLCLPSGSSLSDTDLDRIISVIRSQL